MKTQDPHSIVEVQTPQNSHELHQNSPAPEAPGADSASATNASSDSRKVSREDIELVQNLIERCLQLYMSRAEVVSTLSSRARIEPGFTTLVWQKLEEENADFFRAYYIRLKLKKQIILFNNLLERQYHLSKYPIPPKVPLAPTQNGIHPMTVNTLPMGYPVLQQPPISAAGQPPISAAGQPLVDPMNCGLSSCHVVNGIPAPGSFHPIRMNSGNDIAMKSSTPEAAVTATPGTVMTSISDMAVSPASVASSNHFPFAPSDISEMAMDVSGLDTAFPSDVVTTGGLQLGSDCGAGPSGDSLRSLGQLWNFSFADLTADLTNLGDLGSLVEYTGSPFLPSDSDILLDSPDQDEIVEEYFADAINGPCSQSDEEKT